MTWGGTVVETRHQDHVENPNSSRTLRTSPSTGLVGNLMTSAKERADSVAFKQKKFAAVQMANALGEPTAPTVQYHNRLYRILVGTAGG